MHFGFNIQKIQATHRLRLIDGVSRTHVDVELAKHIVLDLPVHGILVHLGGGRLQEEGEQQGEEEHLDA